MPDSLCSDFYDVIRPEALNKASQIVNYIWINDTKFKPEPQEALCGVPLHYIDKAIQNAHKYPDAKFNLWLDFAMLDAPSLHIAASHIHLSGASNITIKDLRTLDDYRQHKAYHLEKPALIWWRADYARLIVARHCLLQTGAEDVFYADFDIDDIHLNSARTQRSLDRVGMVAARNYEKYASHLENSYFGFRKSTLVPKFLDDLIEDSSLEMTVLIELRKNNRSGLFQNFYSAVENLFDSHKKDATAMALPIAHACYYKIPVNPVYAELKINEPA